MGDKEEELRELVLGSSAYLSLLLGEGVADEKLRTRAIELGTITDKDIISLLELSTDKQPGLYLDTRRLSRLSGPCSFRLLLPKYRGFPVMLFFGDLHQTITGLCETCECQHMEDCCYRSFDPSFLQQLDGLSDEDHPVDLYIETFVPKSDSKWLTQPEELWNTHLEEQKHREEPLQMLKLLYLPCYGKHRNEARCPTRHLRWNFSDPRVGYTKEPDTTSLVLERALMDLTILMYRQKYQQSRVALYYTDRRVYSKLRLLLKMALTEPTHYVKGWLEDSSSLAGKQWRKLDLTMQAALKEYVSRYMHYITSQVKWSEDVRHSILSFLQGKEVDVPLDQQSIIFMGLIEMVSACLEMYSFLRLWKQVTRPWLCVMVMGEQHCKNYASFLTTITDHYRLSIEVSNVTFVGDRIDHHDLEAQCVVFDRHYINLKGLRQYYTGSLPAKRLVERPLSCHENGRFLYNLRRILLADREYDQLIRFKDLDRVFEKIGPSSLYVFPRFKHNYLLKYNEKRETIAKLCEIQGLPYELKWALEVCSYLSRWNTDVEHLLLSKLTTFTPTCLILDIFLEETQTSRPFPVEIWNWLLRSISPIIEWCNWQLKRSTRTELILAILMDKTYQLMPDSTTLYLVLLQCSTDLLYIEFVQRCLLTYKISISEEKLKSIYRGCPDLKAVLTSAGIDLREYGWYLEEMDSTRYKW